MSYRINLYCFINDYGAVFLNRWDEVIGQFKNYDLAFDYAKNNMKLVDVKINQK